MSDIVERLRRKTVPLPRALGGVTCAHDPDCVEAADTIESLRAALAEIDEAQRAAARQGSTLIVDSPTKTEPAEADDWPGFEKHLARQREWSGLTFGPGPRTAGVIDHIRKELREIEADPTDIREWIDVVILALDGAWRAGWQPREIIDALRAKQAKNEAREWPDWRLAPADKAIEHVRSAPAKTESKS